MSVDRNHAQKDVKWRFSYPLYLLLLIVNVIACLFILDRSNSLRAFAQKVDQANHTREIANQIDRRIEALAQTSINLAQNPKIRTSGNFNQEEQDELQLVLETSKSILDVQFSYLMDSTGTVISSTIFEGANPILHRNYGFRPYFTQAMAGNNILYPAIGLSTKTRGLYLAAPVFNEEGKANRVVVIKMALDPIDEVLNKNDQRLALVTNEGIVLATNQPEWYLKSTGKVPSDRLTAIRTSKQFADEPLVQLEQPILKGNLILKGENYIVDEQRIRADNKDVWSLLAMELQDPEYPLPEEQANTFKVIFGILGFLDLIILYLIFNIVVRKKTEKELVHHKNNLEVIVEERTEQLQSANLSLESNNEFIRSTFGRYVSNEVVDSLLSSPGQIHAKGERRVISILMTDIRGFSTLSSKLQPEQVVSILNNYLGEMTNIIMRYGGTIDEFIGDAILVLFGAPLEQSDHADRAVACALEMQLAMKKVNELNWKMSLSEIQMGIGINSGEVVVGNIGSEKRLKYGVVGSAVNLTSRIESYTIGGQVLISASTFDLVKSPLIEGERQQVNPKGWKSAVEIVDIKGISGPYDIHLVEDTFDQISIVGGVRGLFSIVSNKKVGEEKYEANILSWSSGGFIFNSPLIKINNFTNIIITLGELDNYDVQGKVSHRDDGTYFLSVAHVPEPITDFLKLQSVL